MSEDVRDPFADGAVKAHEGGHDKIEDKMNHAHSKKIPPPINFERVLQRLAEIEDELERRGVNELIEEKKTLREALKAAMIGDNTDREYDEVSNFEATLVPRFKDEWDVDVLQDILNAAQHARYTELTADAAAIKAGIKTGDLSRGNLEAKGAVKKVPKDLALYVQEREEETDG